MKRGDFLEVLELFGMDFLPDTWLNHVNAHGSRLYASEASFCSTQAVFRQASVTSLIVVEGDHEQEFESIAL